MGVESSNKCENPNSPNARIIKFLDAEAAYMKTAEEYMFLIFISASLTSIFKKESPDASGVSCSTPSSPRPSTYISKH